MTQKQASKQMKDQRSAVTVDVAISGGGLVGMTLACGLAELGLSVAMIDVAPPATQLEEKFDGRASAVSYAPYLMLRALGIWDHIGNNSQPIEQIHVSDSDLPFFLHFDQDELGDGPLGYMVENRHNRQALVTRLKDLKNVQVLAPDRIVSSERTAAGVTAGLESGMDIKAKLLVAAEGRRSPLREEAGINTMGWGYGQHGIVCTIEHEHPHLAIAHERFLPDGPFAVLPLTGNRSSLVWAIRSDVVDDIMGLSDRAMVSEIQKRVGGFLGDIRVTGPRWSYPLSLQLAECYTDERLVLVGDAAHGMHPIAGQGLNLGYRDIAALLDVLADAVAAGDDIGAAGVLARYENWRRVDNVTLLAVTDGLTRLFSNDIKSLKLLRAVGLGAVNKIPPLRRFFMRHARGSVGHLPRLLRGHSPKGRQATE